MPDEPAAEPGPRNGWEASAPPTDTVLRQFLLAQAAFQRLSGEALDATVVENDRFIAVDTGRPATYLNFGLLRQPLLGPEIERTMAELEAIFGAPGATGFCALYSPLPTPDLSRWGWQLAGHPPLQLRSPFSPLVDTSTVRIEPVTTRNQLATIEHIMIEGFDMGEMRGAPPESLFGAALLDDSRFGAWLGSVDGMPVAGAGSIVEAGLVDVTMVATLPQARRKGAGLAVTQAAARPELGLPAALFSSDEGRPVYETLGFVPLLRGAFWYRNR